MEEIFKVIDFAPDYAVSNIGRVKRITPTINFGANVGRSEFLKGTSVRGWIAVALHLRNRKIKVMRVHRLVLYAFIGPSDLGVNHINGIKSDNRLENLEYCSNGDNVRHALRIGLCDFRGEKGTNSKLKNWQVLEIDKKLKNGKTNVSIAEEYKCSIALISNIKLGIAWSHITGRKKRLPHGYKISTSGAKNYTTT